MTQTTPTTQLTGDAPPGGGAPASTTSPAVRWTVRGAMAALVATCLLYAVSLVPGVRPHEGFVGGWDDWLQGTVFVLAAVVAALRPVTARENRLLWSLVAAALALRATGFVYYFVAIRTQVPQPYPSLADLFWVSSSLCLLAALVVLIRTKSPEVSILILLDGVAVALTAAGTGVLVLYDTLVALRVPGAPTDVVAVNLAYPIIDVALLTLCAARLAMVGWPPPRALVLLVVGVGGVALIDAVFVYQITAGTFRPASYLQVVNLVAISALAFAGWVTPPAERRLHRPPARGRELLDTRIAVPAAAATTSVVVLVAAAGGHRHFTAVALLAVAIMVAIVRAVLTIRQERTVAGGVLLDQGRELVTFQSMVDASTDFIAMGSLRGELLFVNPAGRVLVGLAPDADLTGMRIADFLTEASARAFEEVRGPAVRAVGHWEGESELRNQAGGPPIPVAVSTFLIRHPATGEPLAMATVQRDMTQWHAAEQEVRDLSDERRDLLDRLVQAQEDERARIAADVHDDSVQALAALELRLGMLRRQVEQSDPQLLPGLEASQLTLDTATSRLRHLLFDLDSPARRDGLALALEQAATFVFEDAVHWELVGDREADLPEAQRVTAYRIAKEAMVNARKHADPSLVRIELTAVGDGVEVAVVDDGHGAEPDQLREVPGHLGLGGMRDRAAVAGGRLSITSTPGRGTAVRLWLPDHRDH